MNMNTNHSISDYYLKNILRLLKVLLMHEKFHEEAQNYFISKGHIIEENNFIENTKILCIWNLN